LTSAAALNRVDQLVLFAARGMTRRRLLRRTGGLALSGALGAVFLGPAAQNAAAASRACGGAVVCASDRCTSLGHCRDNTIIGVRPGGYLHGDCFYSSGTQCWTEQFDCLWVCCDCCVNYNTGFGACTNCGGGYYACVCRDKRC
jgi:hypothetical protein